MARALLLVAIVMTGCFDSMELAESSFGAINDENSRASPASVISMGRDDDDGEGRKWHIGGK